jgi:PEP-CTERM motif
MRAKWLVLIGAMLMIGVMSAAPVACANGTLQSLFNTTLLNGGAQACYVEDTLFIFNSFSGAFSASNINVTFVDPGAPTANGSGLVGVTFSPTAGSFTTANAGPSMTIGFSMSICNSLTLCAALPASGSDAYNLGKVVQNSTVVDPSTTSTQFGFIAGTVGATVGTNAATLAGETNQSAIAGTAFEATTTWTFPASATINSVTVDVQEHNTTSGVPEPSTMMLMGCALIGLGTIARKRRKS